MVDHKSRQVVLGIGVYEVVGDVNPVNFHQPKEAPLALPAPPLPAPPPPAIGPPAIHIDSSSSFLTDQAFETRDALLKWVRDVAAGLKFAVVIVNSDYGDGKRKQKLVLGCERGGTYKRTSKKIKFEETRTRKCGCPFKLRGYFHNTTKDWHLSVVNGVHNHEFDKELDGHLVQGRLKPEEKELVAEMTRNLVPPRNIMSTMKDRDPKNVTHKKMLYNVRHRMRQKERGPRNEIQHFFHCLEQKQYVFKFRPDDLDENSTVVKDIFFAHPTSVALFNTFPSVLLMDSTYKTNRYGRPLFEMVGSTSTGLTFNVAFAFLTNEKEENFTWALQHCRSLLRSEAVGPKVTVTDRDSGLMNAVGTVFPDATPLVCRYHVIKNVNAKAKTMCKVRDGDEMSQTQVVNMATNSFIAILDAQTQDDYVEAVVEFRKVCAKWPTFLTYVQKTILDTDKTKVANAWTNEIMHFGNTTTNRAESAHGLLKKYLPDGNGDFVKVWEACEQMLVIKFSDIKTSFGQSLSVKKHRKSYGLPCVCVIAKKIRNRLPIRLDEVNSHWKKLTIEFGQFEDDLEEEVEDDYACTAEFEAIKERLKVVDVSMKAEIRNKLRQLAFPETTTLTSPTVVKKASVVTRKSSGVENSTAREKSYWEHVDAQFPDCQVSQTTAASSSRKGARIGNWTPSQSSQVSSPFFKHMPQFMQPYIEDFVDVVGDGYCGYRVVSLHENGNEDDYELVKLNMIREIKNHRKLYENMFGGKARFEKILEVLHSSPRSTRRSVAPKEKWLSFPDMGHVIATYYNRIVVELTSPIIGVSLIPEHFVQVKLKPGAILPKASAEWRRYCTDEAMAWEYPFMDRISVFEDLIDVERKDLIKKRKIKVKKIVGIGSSKDNPLTCSDSE
ncbi:protein FAR1-RELATED SEQUENCE [Trifolium repens]|nr:protein FAR1-RELATED SEQUENCE [Trifolium repens]